MQHLNYSHLQYFWAVAREGSVVKASELLHLTPQTISGQLKQLEASIGNPLFERVGRGLVLTDLGNVVFQYADEIFSIGAELATVVRGRQAGAQTTLTVGVVNSMPKFVAERIISPALVCKPPIRLRCHEARLDELLGALATHRLDLVLSDQPIPSGTAVRAYNHKLGESGLAFFVRRSESRRYRKDFPASLNGAPMLLPAPQSALRLRLDDWFEGQSIAPRVVGEFDDSALLKAFGEAGAGIFVAPSAIENAIESVYKVNVIGRTDEVVERFYAISPERRLKHPAVVAITDAARTELFSAPPASPPARQSA